MPHTTAAFIMPKWLLLQDSGVHFEPSGIWVPKQVDAVMRLESGAAISGLTMRCSRKGQRMMLSNETPQGGKDGDIHHEGWH
jgi:hypothetical protein